MSSVQLCLDYPNKIIKQERTAVAAGFEIEGWKYGRASSMFECVSEVCYVVQFEHNKKR